MDDYKGIVEALRSMAKTYELSYCTSTREYKLAVEAANVIEELSDKVKRAVAFYTTAEVAECARKIGSATLERALDPEWQKAHAEFGFDSPIYDVYKALGIFDDEGEE